MNKMTNELLSKLKNKMTQEAHDRRESAGFNGEMGDGGASQLECEWKFYTYGIQSVVPPEWEHFLKECDPEYKDYLRLKKKFE